MTTNPSGFDPLWMLRAPWSGDIAQRITAPWFSPSLTVNYAGDPAVEDRVVTEVASYGKQLGWHTEIAIASESDRNCPASIAQLRGKPLGHAVPDLAPPRRSVRTQRRQSTCLLP